MALPTKIKTWQYNVNQTLSGTTPATNTANVLFGIASSMWGFATLPWIHWGSCNGATFNNNVASPNKWVSAANVVKNSYMVLENPKNGMQVCLHLVNDNPYTGTFAVSLGGAFGSVGSGGTGTDGSLTNRPTAGDELVFLNNTAFGTGLFVTTYRLHVQHSTDGACTRVVLYLSTVPIHMWIFDEVSNPIPGFTLPVAGIQVSDNSTSRCTYGIWNDNANMYGRIGGTNFAMYMTCEGAVTSTVGEQATFADDDTGEWPIMPIGLLSTSGSHRGRKGALYDLWWGSTAAGNGNTYPDDASKTFAQFGHLVFPWNGTTPGIS